MSALFLVIAKPLGSGAGSLYFPPGIVPIIKDDQVWNCKDRSLGPGNYKR